MKSLANDDDIDRDMRGVQRRSYFVVIDVVTERYRSTLCDSIDSCLRIDKSDIGV